MMIRRSNPTVTALLLAVALATAAPAGAQIRDELLGDDPLGNRPGVTEPAPVQDPNAPQKEVPKATRPDPRAGKVPSEASKPGALPEPTLVRPGIDRLRPEDIDSRKKSDLGIRIIEAIAPQGEVVVEVKNHGPNPLERVATVAVFVDEGDACTWPNGNPLQTVTNLRVGETRRVYVRIGGARCGDRYEKPREEIGVLARVKPSMSRGEGYADPNPANDRQRTTLASVIRDSHTTAAPRGEKWLKIDLSNLVFKLNCREGRVQNRDYRCELQWVSWKFHEAPERKVRHAQLSLMGGGRPGAHHDSYLAVRDGDFVGVPHAASAVTHAWEGEEVELEIKARDRDCAGDRSCSRGDTYTTKIRFEVPHFPAGFRSNCDAKQSLWEMRNVIQTNTLVPGNGVVAELEQASAVGGETYPARICFEDVTPRRTGF